MKFREENVPIFYFFYIISDRCDKMSAKNWLETAVYWWANEATKPCNEVFKINNESEV